MTNYRDILTNIEAADNGLEDLPEATTDAEAVLRMDLANTLAKALRIARVTTDTEAILRMDLANTLAKALRIARALAADEGETHESSERQIQHLGRQSPA